MPVNCFVSESDSGVKIYPKYFTKEKMGKMNSLHIYTVKPGIRDIQGTVKNCPEF